MWSIHNTLSPIPPTYFPSSPNHTPSHKYVHFQLSRESCVRFRGYYYKSISVNQIKLNLTTHSVASTEKWAKLKWMASAMEQQQWNEEERKRWRHWKRDRVWGRMINQMISDKWCVRCVCMWFANRTSNTFILIDWLDIRRIYLLLPFVVCQKYTHKKMKWKKKN